MRAPGPTQGPAAAQHARGADGRPAVEERFIENVDLPRTRDLPAGFERLQAIEGFIDHNGPLYFRRDDDGGFTFGHWVEMRHCNPLGICHGGWVATLCDMAMPVGARLASSGEDYMLTVHLSVDFLGGARLGSWLEGKAQELRRTRRLVFLQGLLHADNEVVARCSGVFRRHGSSRQLPEVAIGR